MKRHRLGFILLTVICYLSSAIQVYAEVKIHPNAGSTSATFLKIGIGARPIAMGGAFSALADDVNTLYWNPAGIVQIERPELSAMHNEWFENIRYEFLGYVQPFTRSTSHVTRALGLSLFGLHMKNDLERRSGEKENIPEDPLSVSEGSFGAYDLAAMFTYGQKINQSFSLGGNLKIIKQTIDNEQAYGVAIDLGSLHELKFETEKETLKYDEEKKVWVHRIKVEKEKLKIGFVLQNIGPGIKFIEKGYNLPLNLKVGAAYKTLDENLTLVFDVNQPIDNYLNFSFGAEYWLLKMLALRAGYKYRLYGNELGDLSGLSLGFGVKLKNLQFDYAFVPYGVLGNTHRISFIARFKQSPKERKKAEGSEEEIKRNQMKNVKLTPIMISARERVSQATVELDNSDLLEMSFRTNRRSIEGLKIEISTRHWRADWDKDELVYRLFEIKNNLTTNERETARLTFKVSKNWVKENKIDSAKIILNGCEKGKWEKLLTKFEKEEGNDYFYSTELKGFPFFAITGKKLER